MKWGRAVVQVLGTSLPPHCPLGSSPLLGPQAHLASSRFSGLILGTAVSRGDTWPGCLIMTQPPRPRAILGVWQVKPEKKEKNKRTQTPLPLPLCPLLRLRRLPPVTPVWLTLMAWGSGSCPMRPGLVLIRFPSSRTHTTLGRGKDETGHGRHHPVLHLVPRPRGSSMPWEASSPWCESLLMNVRTKDPKHGNRALDLSVTQAVNKGSNPE